MSNHTKQATNNSNEDFSAYIWEAANALRGSMDASEYKHVFLGLIFLKYVSDRFEHRYEELVDENEGFEEDRDEYTKLSIFFVPKESRWSKIVSKAHQPEIGTIIDEAMRAIEKENPQLKGVLPKNYARPELDKRRLGEIINIFTNIRFKKSHSKDLLGEVYQYCLERFAEQEGKRAGEFFTPTSIVRTLVEVLQPYKGRIYDPCCGSAGMFVQSASFIGHHSGNIHDIAIYGQEANPTTRKLAIMNLAIRGIPADLGPHHADTFLHDLHPYLRADFVMANPPFNLSNWGQQHLLNDQRWKFGTPPKGNANFAWMQHMIHHLSPRGKIGLVLANGSLSSNTSGEGDIRRNIIEADLVEGIVALPGQLFMTTGIPVCLWFLNKKKKHPQKTLFVDARKLGSMINRRQRTLTDTDIQQIAHCFREVEDGSFEPTTGYSALVTTSEITKNDFILTPGRYVGIEEQEDDGEPFEEKMERLTSELSEMFARSRELENEIRERLGDLGYEL